MTEVKETTAAATDPAVKVYDKGSIAPHAKGSPPGASPPDRLGHVGLPAGEKQTPTDTIPAVAGTTLTQVLDKETLHAQTEAESARAVPFGRQMNSANGHPSEIIHDPQVFPRAEVPGADTPAKPMTTKAIQGAPENK